MYVINTSLIQFYILTLGYRDHINADHSESCHICEAAGTGTGTTERKFVGPLLLRLVLTGLFERSHWTLLIMTAIRDHISRTHLKPFRCTICAPEMRFEKRNFRRHLDDHHKESSQFAKLKRTLVRHSNFDDLGFEALAKDFNQATTKGQMERILAAGVKKNIVRMRNAVYEIFPACGRFYR